MVGRLQVGRKVVAELDTRMVEGGVYSYSKKDWLKIVVLLLRPSANEIFRCLSCLLNIVIVGLNRL